MFFYMHLICIYGNIKFILLLHIDMNEYAYDDNNKNSSIVGHNLNKKKQQRN